MLLYLLKRFELSEGASTLGSGVASAADWEQTTPPPRYLQQGIAVQRGTTKGRVTRVITTGLPADDEVGNIRSEALNCYAAEI